VDRAFDEGPFCGSFRRVKREQVIERQWGPREVGSEEGIEGATRGAGQFQSSFDGLKGGGRELDFLTGEGPVEASDRTLG
jgi:hypothetical protein